MHSPLRTFGHLPKNSLEKGSISMNTPMDNTILRQIVLGAALASGWAALCAQPLPAAEDAQADPWYARSFFLLHLDHHTNDKMEVGRDADPAETARLINLIKPDVIQIHAKGNPGWTTYPSQVGHTSLPADIHARDA